MLQTDWNTNGKWIGIETRTSGANADFINFKNDTVSKFIVDHNGIITNMGTPALAAGSTIGGNTVATTNQLPIKIASSIKPAAAHSDGLSRPLRLSLD